MNNTATRMIRSEEITIDMRICTILAGGKKPGEVYFAAIAPDMELTVITLDEAPDILPCFDESDQVRKHSLVLLGETSRRVRTAFKMIGGVL